MEMPHLGATVTVVAMAPNVEVSPCSGRFFKQWERTEVVVTEHIARRLVDGSLMIPSAVAALAAKGE